MSTVAKMRTTVAFLAENKTERFLRTRAIRQRLLKGEGARENTQCRGAIDCRPRIHRVAFYLAAQIRQNTARCARWRLTRSALVG